MRVAIAEDSVLLREGLARLLADADFDVVARCGDADELRRALRAEVPDVVIVDIRHDHPGTGVLVLSQYVEFGLAMKLLGDSAEGVGYLLKDRVSDVPEFL